MTDIYIIRHGEAEGNVFRRFHGQYNSLLTPRGYQQLQYLEKRFSGIAIDACFSSDLTRTSLTARAVYVPKGLPLRRDSRFREVSIGPWEDIPYAYLEFFESERMGAFNRDPVNWQVAGAESYWEYSSRFIEGLTQAAEAFDGGSIAVFSHGAVLRGALMRLFFENDCKKVPYSDNTGVCKLHYDRGRFTYEYLNDSSHLPPELSTYHLQRWWRQTDNRRECGVYFRDCEEGEELSFCQAALSGSRIRRAILLEKPVGAVALGAPRDGKGMILGLALDPGYEGRYYGDQLLGEAVSYYRSLGCRELCMACDENPDDVFSRYGFDPVTRCRSIDADAFAW